MKQYISFDSQKDLFHIFLGNFHSTFGGKGMEFRDFQLYSDSMDARDIDWLVSSKEQEIVSRRYREERESHLLFLCDATPTLGIHNGVKSALMGNIVELLTYSAQRWGERYALYLSQESHIHKLPMFEAGEFAKRIRNSQASSLGSVSDFLLSRSIPKSIVFLISDRENVDFGELSGASMRHDLIFVHLSSHFENTLNGSGMNFASTGGAFFPLDLDNESLKSEYILARKQKLEEYKRQARQVGISYINIDDSHNLLLKFIELMQDRTGKK